MIEKINILSLIHKICKIPLFRGCPPCLAALSRGTSRFRSNTKRQLVVFLNTAHFLTIGVSLALVVAFFLYAVDGQPFTTESDSYAAAETEEFLPNVREIVGEIHSGDSLTSSFRSNGVDEEIQQSVITAFDGLVDFREMKPEDRYTLT